MTFLYSKNEIQMRTRGEPKNPKVLQTSYLEAPNGPSAQGLSLGLGQTVFTFQLGLNRRSGWNPNKRSGTH